MTTKWNTILSTAIILFASTSVVADQVPQLKEVASCAMMNGNFVHAIYKENNIYKAYVALPSHFKNPSAEVIEAKKKEYANWDGTGPSPSDPRTKAITIPVENSNFVTFDKDRLLERMDVLESLYPSAKSGENLPSGAGTLRLSFEEQNCSVFEKEGLSSARCETDTPTLMNGVQVDRIVVYIRNSKNAKLVEDPNNPKDMIVRQQNIVDTAVTFWIGNQSYRSAFTYEPNGDDVQCNVKQTKLMKYDD